MFIDCKLKRQKCCNNGFQYNKSKENERHASNTKKGVITNDQQGK